ncbi:MAG: hypothetical protein Q9198_011419 [Flavoplaca austrocitrina]
MVSLGSAGTILGWVLWDFWVGQSEAAQMTSRFAMISNLDSYEESAARGDRRSDSHHFRPPLSGGEPSGLGLTLAPSNPAGRNVYYQPAEPQLAMSTPSLLSSTTLDDGKPVGFYGTSPIPNHYSNIHILSHRNQQRLNTVKSAILIYCVLHGLSPILKSLTMSTSEDSIWALSSILMCINILFFDYGGGVGVK